MARDLMKTTDATRGAEIAVAASRKLRAEARPPAQIHLRVFHALCAGRPGGCYGTDMELSLLAGSVLLDAFGDDLVKTCAVATKERRMWALPPRAKIAFQPSWNGWVESVKDAVDRESTERLMTAWKAARRRGEPAVPTDAGLGTVVQAVGLPFATSLRPVIDTGLDWLYSHAAVPSDSVTMCVDAAIAIDSAVPTLAQHATGIVGRLARGGNPRAARNLLDEIALSPDAFPVIREYRVGGGTLGEPSYGLARVSVPVERVLHDMRAPCSELKKPLALTRACGAATVETVPPGTSADTVLKLMELSAQTRDECTAHGYSDLQMALAARLVAATWASLPPATRAALQQHRPSEPTWPEGAMPFVDSVQRYAQMFESAADHGNPVPSGVGAAGRPVAPHIAPLYHGADILVYAPDVRFDSDGSITVTLDRLNPKPNVPVTTR